MIVNKCMLKLHLEAQEVEVEPGIWEEVKVTKEVKAIKESIFQSRLDAAKIADLVLSGRFKVRNEYGLGSIKYVEYQGNKYKVTTLFQDGNYWILETGEVI